MGCIFRTVEMPILRLTVVASVCAIAGTTDGGGDCAEDDDVPSVVKGIDAGAADTTDGILLDTCSRVRNKHANRKVRRGSQSTLIAADQQHTCVFVSSLGTAICPAADAAAAATCVADRIPTAVYSTRLRDS